MQPNMIDRISYQGMRETENAASKTDRPCGLGSRSGTQGQFLQEG